MMGDKPVRLRHHKEWDRQVLKLTGGGLTILKPAGVGYWIDHSEGPEPVRERMIPVQIACTDKQMDQIVTMTLRHYRQKAIMLYVVSEKVEIRHAEV